MKQRKINQFTIGIDEVGRGPLAGPVVVCALALPRGLSLRASHKMSSSLRGGPAAAGPTRQSHGLPPLRDSKKLSALQRERWYEWIKAHPRISYAVSRVYPRGIERLNISEAANLAATRACAKLLRLPSLRSASWRRPQSADEAISAKINVRLLPATLRSRLKAITDRNDEPPIKVLLDGGLYLRQSIVRGQWSNVRTRTIIKGDEKIPAISLASIIAKVTRDRFMDKLHKKYPQYGFNEHKGYGTKAHYAALEKYGATEAHRATFLREL